MFAYEKWFSNRCVVPHTIQTGIGASPVITSFMILTWPTAGNSSAEIRFQGQLEDGRPALDEFLAEGASVHMEQMSHDQLWMGIQAGGRDFHL